MGKIRIDIGIKRRIEMEERSKRNPRKILSINFTKPRSPNNLGYEK